MVGMNPAVSAMNWLDNVPNGWRRVLARQQAGADLIVVDPLRTPTAEKADTHVAIRPGGDWAFLLGLIKVILDHGWEHRDDCELVTGFEHIRDLVAVADLDDLSARCDVPVADIGDVAERFAQARTAMCLSHTGVSQNRTGTLGEWFANLLNVITGRLDRPGGRYFEPGYVDTLKIFDMLAKPLEGTTRVRGLPAVAGHHALSELPDEILTPGPGRDPGVHHRRRKPGGVRAQRRRAGPGAGQSGTAGGRRPRAAGESPARPLADPGGALAGAFRPHAAGVAAPGSALRPVRPPGGGAAARCPGGVGVLHRPVPGVESARSSDTGASTGSSRPAAGWPG